MQAGDGVPLDDPRLVSAGGDELCRITLTSGSTGEAKGIPFTHRLVFERNARLAFTRDTAFQTCSRFYCDLGFATDPGFRDLLRLTYKGGTIFYYGEDPESLVQGLTLYQVQGMMASPEGLSQYLKFYDAYPNVACALDHIITQGAAMPRSLSERVRARMCANLSSTYGATETGILSSISSRFRRLFHARRHRRLLTRCCGRTGRAVRLPPRDGQRALRRSAGRRCSGAGSIRATSAGCSRTACLSFLGANVPCSISAATRCGRNAGRRADGARGGRAGGGS
jgi:acyl-CoA synthetase (AMP-forming)/AMP-acid ligase II